MIRLQDSALFIADSHYNSSRQMLLEILLKIQNNQIVTSQIFFMGDMFDFLSQEIEYFKTINHNVIDLINTLSLSIEIIYIEGNHDFNLSTLFPNITVVSREIQPIPIEYKLKNILIAHGDIFTPISYEIYTIIIRNHYFLRFLNLIDINNFISKFVEQKLKSKNICHKQDNFTQFIEKRISLYDTDLTIEGHFHQGYINDKYINIPSLCCDNRYIAFEDDIFIFKSL